MIYHVGLKYKIVLAITTPIL